MCQATAACVNRVLRPDYVAALLDCHLRAPCSVTSEQCDAQARARLHPTQAEMRFRNLCAHHGRACGMDCEDVADPRMSAWLWNEMADCVGGQACMDMTRCMINLLGTQLQLCEAVL